MIYVIHGNDVVTSRKQFLEKRTKYSSLFDAENINLVELSQAVQGSGLFKSDNKVFIDNLFTRKGAKNLDQIIEILNSADSDVYLYSDKDVPAKTLGLLPKHKSEYYKIKENIFYFLDGLRPKSPQNVTKFREVSSTSDVEVIFFMLLRQFRLLISVSGSAGGKIDEAKRLQDWQMDKLQRQARLFGLEGLKKIYKKLYKIDKEQKTGQTSLSLTQSIDFLLLEI